MAIDGAQIITNTFATGCTPVPSSATQTCAPVSKLVECVYGVQVNYGTSSLSIVTGPPGAVTSNATHRCWNFATSGSGSTMSVLYNRGAAGAACPVVPTTNAATGTLGAGGAFSQTLPPGYGAACADATGGYAAVTATKLPSNYTAASGSSFWLQPYAISFGPGVGPNSDTSRALVQCLSGTGSAVLADPAVAATASKPAFALAKAGSLSSSCFVVQESLSIGIVQAASLTGAGCSAVPATWDVTMSANFPNWTAPVSSSGAPSAAAAAPKTVLKSVPVVTYSLPLTGTFSALTIADPCTGVALRLNAATAANVPVFSLAMGSITDSSNVVIKLAPDSPVNTLTALPANCANGATTSRRLGALAAAADGAARRLPSGSGSIAMVAQVPGGQTAAGLASVIGNTAAPAMPPSLSSSVTSAAPSGAAGGQAVAAVQVVYPARKNAYVVDPLIEQFHSLPRVCLYQCKGTATNTFALDVTYAQGAVGIAAGLFALAAISLVIYSTAYCCGLCACAGCKCRKARDPATLRNVCSPRSVYIIFGIINIGLLLACLAYLGRFPTGLQQLSDGLTQFGGNFTLAGSYMTMPCDTSATGSTGRTLGDNSCTVKTFDFAANGAPVGVTAPAGPTGPTPHDVRSVFGAANAANFEVTQLQASCTTASGGPNQCPSAVTSILSAVSTGETQAAAQAGSIGVLLNLVGDSLTKATGGIDVATYKRLATLGGYAVFGLLAGFVAIYTFFVCKSTCACCIHGVSSVATIILVSILMVIAGLFYAFGVIGADICYNPNGTIQTLAAPYLPAGLAGDTVNYYLTCGANPATPPIGAVGMVNGIVSQVQGAAAQAQGLYTQATTPTDSSYAYLQALRDASPDYMGVTTATVPAASLKSLNVQMGYSADATTSLAAVLSCQTMDPILSTLWTGVCTNGVATIIGIARILIAASVLLFIQLGIGIDMCCFHPGITSRYWAEEGVNPEGDGGKGGQTMTSSV